MSFYNFLKMYLRIAPRLRKILPVFIKPGRRWGSSSSKSGQDLLEKKSEVALPPEPTHCCMSGCPNCVWIKYAQELAEKFDNGDVIAKQKILEKVKDPSLRAFLLTSLGLQDTGVKTERT